MEPQFHFHSVWYAFLAVGGGLAALAAGGEILVAWSVKLARSLGMGPLLIGLTIVAFGTSLPELFVSLSALSQGLPDMMIGNVIGSNIANVGLILGLAALIRPFSMHFKTVSSDLYLLLLASVAFMAFTVVGFFSRSAGMVSVSLLILYTIWSYRKASATRKKNIAETDRQVFSSPSRSIMSCFIILGLLLLTGGSSLFIAGAEDVARFFGLSELVIGLTLAAVGTSLPELASSFAAVRRKQEDILVGNIVGSNLFNLLMVLGASAVLFPFPLSATLMQRDLPVMTGFSFFLLLVLAFWHGMRRWHGFLLCLAYGFYIYTLV